jgi:hypothetical protein
MARLLIAQSILAPPNPADVAPAATGVLIGTSPTIIVREP